MSRRLALTFHGPDFPICTADERFGEEPQTIATSRLKGCDAAEAARHTRSRTVGGFCERGAAKAPRQTGSTGGAATGSISKDRFRLGREDFAEQAPCQLWRG
jgi:hypothetical protein